MTLTLTLSRLPSFDRPLEKLATAALTAPPIKNSGSGVRAAPPTILITLPCEAFNSGQNSRVSRTAPKNFRAKPSSQTASGKSRNAPARVAPALLTSTSQRRKRRARAHSWTRSEEHTSELQSHLNLVCRLLLEKKKKQQKTL